jgi:hypothetical protein
VCLSVRASVYVGLSETQRHRERERQGEIERVCEREHVCVHVM